MENDKEEEADDDDNLSVFVRGFFGFPPWNFLTFVVFLRTNDGHREVYIYIAKKMKLVRSESKNLRLLLLRWVITDSVNRSTPYRLPENQG